MSASWQDVIRQARGGQWITDVPGDPWSYDSLTLGALLDRGLITWTDSRNHYVLTEKGEEMAAIDTVRDDR